MAQNRDQQPFITGSNPSTLPSVEQKHLDYASAMLEHMHKTIKEHSESEYTIIKFFNKLSTYFKKILGINNNVIRARFIHTEENEESLLKKLAEAEESAWEANKANRDFLAIIQTKDKTTDKTKDPYSTYMGQMKEAVRKDAERLLKTGITPNAFIGMSGQQKALYQEAFTNIRQEIFDTRLYASEIQNDIEQFTSVSAKIDELATLQKKVNQTPSELKKLEKLNELKEEKTRLSNKIVNSGDIFGPFASVSKEIDKEEKKPNSSREELQGLRARKKELYNEIVKFVKDKNKETPTSQKKLTPKDLEPKDLEKVMQDAKKVAEYSITPENSAKAAFDQTMYKTPGQIAERIVNPFEYDRRNRYQEDPEASDFAREENPVKKQHYPSIPKGLIIPTDNSKAEKIAENLAKKIAEAKKKGTSIYVNQVGNIMEKVFKENNKPMTRRELIEVVEKNFMSQQDVNEEVKEEVKEVIIRFTEEKESITGPELIDIVLKDINKKNLELQEDVDKEVKEIMDSFTQETKSMTGPELNALRKAFYEREFRAEDEISKLRVQIQVANRPELNAKNKQTLHAQAGVLNFNHNYVEMKPQDFTEQDQKIAERIVSNAMNADLKGFVEAKTPNAKNESTLDKNANNNNSFTLTHGTHDKTEAIASLNIKKHRGTLLELANKAAVLSKQQNFNIEFTPRKPE